MSTARPSAPPMPRPPRIWVHDGEGEQPRVVRAGQPSVHPRLLHGAAGGYADDRTAYLGDEGRGIGIVDGLDPVVARFRQRRQVSGGEDGGLPLVLGERQIQRGEGGDVVRNGGPDRGPLDRTRPRRPRRAQGLDLLLAEPQPEPGTAPRPRRSAV